MALPTKSGQVVRTTFSTEPLTVECFFGESGIEYKTAKEAYSKNPGTKPGMICIKNKEYGGAMLQKDCELLVKESDLVPNP
jgi:hypothetical protein